MTEWKEYKLEEIGVVITGKTPSARNPEDWGDEVLFVTPSDFRNYGKYANNSERKLSNIGAKRLVNKMLPPKSILVTCIGSDMGKVVMSKTNCITNQQINALIPDKQFDNDFLYYSLISIYDTLRIMGGDGTAVPIVNKGDFEKIVLSIPFLDEQRRIASILTSFDDKIDLLRRENATLEAMAETLFRQWFVVEAKYGEVVLGDVVKTTSGGTPSRKHPDYYENGTVCWVKSKELNGSFISSTEELITENAVANSSAKILPEKSVLIAMYGATVGEYGILSRPMTCNQAVCALIPNEKYPFTYLFVWAATMKQEFINLATGAAQQNISQDLVKQQYVYGDIEKIKEYDSCVRSLFDKMENNQEQINTLIQTRDGLLPRLMSGEIKV